MIYCMDLPMGVEFLKNYSLESDCMGDSVEPYRKDKCDVNKTADQ